MKHASLSLLLACLAPALAPAQSQQQPPLPRLPDVPPPLVALRDAEPASEITLVNNHDFPTRELFSIPVSAASENAALAAVPANAQGGAGAVPLQLRREGNRVYAWLDVPLAAGASARYTIRPAGASTAASAKLQVAVSETFESGLPKEFTLDGKRLPSFDLLIVETVTALNKFQDKREDKVRAAFAESVRDNKLRFRQTAVSAGAALAEFCYEGEGGRFNDYTLRVVHRVRADGAIDTAVTVGTRKIRAKETYLAIAKIFPGTAGAGAVVDWKGEKHDLPPGGASPQRTLRTQNWTRDVNWFGLVSNVPGTLARPLVAAYTPNLARIDDRDTLRNANDFLVDEVALCTDEGWALLSEISRGQPVVKSYVTTYFVPPATDETVALKFRSLPPGAHTPQSLDNTLVAFAGYQGARVTAPGKLEISLGVSGVSFGTNYFPNATFGENFEYWRGAGLGMGRLGRDLHRWWPGFRHWEFFKDEIRRDIRIINSLGMDWFRIHAMPVPDYKKDYLTTPEGKWMFEYLEFMAGVARECGVGIRYDFHTSPADAELVASRLGDVIKFYEIDNEVLIIPGAKTEYFDYWKKTRDTIHKVRPGAPVFTTGAAAAPYSLLDSLARRGIIFDAVGQHGYIDRREAPAHFRDNAISLGGYATERGKTPLNTEYNWRMITRETEEQQARHFGEISRYYFSPRAMPVAFQFQFQETFCVPPRTRGALRHYEPLRVDRTPKPQAFVFKESIRKYGNANNRLRQLDITVDDDVRLAPGAEFSYNVTIRNVAARPLSLTLTPRLPEGITAAGDALTLDLRPGEKRTIARKARAATELKPGVYHFFEEARYDDDVYFGWGIARHVAKPQLDLDRPVLRNVRYEGGVTMLDRLDLSTFASSVFGEEAPALEVDWALYLYHSLRCATGAPVTREKDTTLSAAEGAKKNLVVVGTPASNALVKAVEDQLPASFRKLRDGVGLVARVDEPLGNRGVTWLVVTGADAEGVERAASDLLYRYWRFAKDAASFREGMPPIVGSWAGTEPERKPARRRTTETTAARTFESVVLRAPATAKIGEELRVIAMESAEPPGPAGGLRIGVYLREKRVRTAVTNATGEVVFQLDAPGEYEIRAEKIDAAPRRISVTQ
jgi:hypothetical protein